MTPGRYEFCATYVRDADAEAVRDILAPLLGADVRRRTLSLPDLSMDVRANPDLDLGRGDDFVHWPVLIEAESGNPADRHPMLDVMSRVITALWDAGHPAVAACDFEDELPWKGGIERVRSAGRHETREGEHPA